VGDVDSVLKQQMVDAGVWLQEDYSLCCQLAGACLVFHCGSGGAWMSFLIHVLESTVCCTSRRDGWAMDIFRLHYFSELRWQFPFATELTELPLTAVTFMLGGFNFLNIFWAYKVWHLSPHCAPDSRFDVWLRCLSLQQLVIGGYRMVVSSNSRQRPEKERPEKES